jgi:predicted peptidase
MTHHVIYLPGVGDHKNAAIQIKALKKWKKFGLEAHFHHINWHDNEAFKDKKDSVLKLIDELYSFDKSVSVVGVSAGASMAMNVYAERKNQIKSVVFICGKINNSATLGKDYKQRNPRLFESVSESEKTAGKLTAYDKAKMLTIQPVYDGVVAAADGRISGTAHRKIFAVFHAAAIYLSITAYRRISINFIKSKSVQ